MNKIFLCNSKYFVEFKKLIDHHVNGQLDPKKTLNLYQDISTYLNDPLIDNFKLEVIATKIIHLGANYEPYVSALLFKSMPDDFTRKELIELEDELYLYIEKELYGKGIDKIFTAILIQQTIKHSPDISATLAEKKAIGNWGWLIPHALTQVIIEVIFKKIQQAILEDKKVNRKGRIRIKKM